jgi:AcrR family transcriptional regulator
MATPRKPRQERSRATVAAIIDATVLCVARDGVATTTARRIAETAGISIGSFYEYFANKEAVFEAMNRRLTDETVEFLRSMAPQLMGLEIREAILFMFRGFSDFLRRDDARYLKVAQQMMSQQQGRTSMESVNKTLMELVMQYLMAHPQYMKIRDFPALSYVFINGGIFLVLRHLSSEKPLISFEQLGQMYADLFGTYFEQQAGPA